MLVCAAIPILFAITACSGDNPSDDADTTSGSKTAENDDVDGPGADAKPAVISEALPLRQLPASVNQQPDDLPPPPEFDQPEGLVASMTREERVLWRKKHRYSQATCMRRTISRDREAVMRQREMGNDPEPFEKRLAFSLNLQQKILDHLMSVYSMSSAELDALIAYGDAEGWPQGVDDQ